MFDWLELAAAARAAQTPARLGVGQTGLIGAVRVASTAGWRSACSIVPGDKVLTFDCGMQPVAQVHSMPLWQEGSQCPVNLWPVEVPAGALGNRDLMYLAADQAVLIESDVAEDLTGDPFALIPARSLDGVRGMCRVPPPAQAEVTILQFESEQIVFANSGAMFHCPSVTEDLIDAGNTPAGYDVLDMERARLIAQALDTPSGAAA
ncbi:Hint domain-containing protein [Pelagivirga sediminicola]|nr:Hint domain-containing protein [Pelagivirga sediminicola]